jgi:hypothetical protein
MTSTFTEDLDDYEQKLLKFTGPVQSNLDALLRLLDNAKIDPSDNDKLMNLAIGLSQYVDTMTDDLCEDLENHIKKGLSPVKFTFSTVISKDYTITFPPDVIGQLGWEEGDLLTWRLNADKSVSITRIPLTQG